MNQPETVPESVNHSESDSHTNSVDSRDPVDLLAEEFSARLRLGEHPSIEEYVLRSPEHESSIRQLFPTIALVEQMSHQEYSTFRSKRRILDREEVIGDFRILREIGRGGMGVVYEAMQQSLERRVALKVLGSGIADSPQQLQRFRREAESAARLHHTNIVPVYGIGEEDGIHFYAMQFIDGATLADAIKSIRQRSSMIKRSSESTSSIGSDQTKITANGPPEFPVSEPQNEDRTVVIRTELKLLESHQWANEHKDPASHVAESKRCPAIFDNRDTPEYFSRIADLAAKVADALSYAHGHGVLHRDIKPSNLMLDRMGDVWIMDFGLVKLAERHDLTQTGEIVGTVRYMAPEQLSGQADVTADIYSLGLTLFELLTLKPAFDGDSMVTLSQRLKGCEIPRPRSINSQIPRDLETIILKATAREPSSRYSSAATFAEDLRRFCEDRPILARRSSYAERLWRWSRRNPALALTTSSIVLLLGLVAIIASIGRLRVESALLEATKSQKQAEIAQIGAEKNLDSAISAFDSIMGNVMSRGVPRSLAMDLSISEDGLAQTPLSTADALLLDDLLGFYRSLSNQSKDSARLRQRIADAHHRAGTILVRLGRLNEAEKDFRKALELLAASRNTGSENIDIAVKSASIQNDIGQVILKRGEFHETHNAHLEARAILLELSAAARKEPAVRFELARATDLFASIDIRSGTDEGPGSPPSEPTDGHSPRFHRDRPGPGRPDLHVPHGDPDHRPPPGSSGRFAREGRPLGPPPGENLSDRLKNALPSAFGSNHGAMTDSLAETLLEACNEFRSLASDFPENTEYRFRLAQCLRHRLVHAASNGNLDVAHGTFVESVQILDRLVSNAPNDPRYQLELADTLTQALRAQTCGDARKSLERADAIASSLNSRFPNVTEYQLLHGTVLARRATVEALNDDTSDARESLNRSIRILKTLVEQFPDQGVIQIPLAKSSQQLGDLLRTTAMNEPNPMKQLELSRLQLQTAIDRFEAYLTAKESDSAIPKAGHFNTLIKSNLYASLAKTLAELNLPEDAERARKKASHLRRPGPPPK